MNTYIEWIFFDLGGVLYTLDFEAVWNGFTSTCNCSSTAVKEALYNEESFNAYETGAISSLEYYSRVMKALGCRMDFKSFAQIWNSILRKREEMFLYAYWLKKDYQILLLSNTNELNAEAMRDDLFSLTPHIVYSFKVGYMKPDRRIYLAALEKAHTDSSHVLFVDDLEENIITAAELGMNVHKFQSRELLIECIRGYEKLSQKVSPDR